MRLWFLFMHLSLVPHCSLLIDLNLEVLARLEWVLQSAVCFIGQISIKNDNSNNNNLSFSFVLDTCDLLHWLPISASLLCCVLGCAPSFFCGLSPDVAACLVLRSPTRESEVTMSHMRHHVGHGGALVEAITLNWRVVGSTPALAAV